MSILLVDLSTVPDPEEVEKAVAFRPWTHVYLLLTPSQNNDNYMCPSIRISGTMLSHNVPKFRLIYVPLTADPYSYASGFISAVHSQDVVVCFTNAKARQLKPLKNSVDVCVEVSNKDLWERPSSSESEASGEEEEEEEEDEDEEDDSPGECSHTKTADSQMMSSIMQFMGTSSGKNLIGKFMSDMGGDQRPLN
jgi:hypothetical protein